MASVSGRVVALPSPVVRSGTPLARAGRVPAARARRRSTTSGSSCAAPSRLLIVGDVRVPRVTARIDAPGPPTRATIEITPAAPVTATTEAGRVLVRIDADALDLALPAGGGGLIEQIRAGDQPNTVDDRARRARRATPRVVRDDGRQRDARRDRGAAATRRPRRAAPPACRAPAPAAPPHAAAGARTPRAALADDRDRPRAWRRRRRRRAVPAGAEEKAASRSTSPGGCAALLETRLGVRVSSRATTTAPSALDERAALANNSKADLFLSLHANAAPSPRVAGAEVYPPAARSAKAKTRGARRRPKPVSLPVLGGGDARIDVIRWDLAQARHVDALGGPGRHARGGAARARSRWGRGRCSRRRCACSSARTCRRRSSRWRT